MTKLYWGVDSADYATNLLESVAGAYGRAPAWWGRYWPNYQPTPQEITALHGAGIGLLCIANGEDAASVGFGEDYAHGKAVEACQGWASLGAPRGVAIVVDVEQPWWLSPDFVVGWLEGCRSQGYIGSAYLNPTSGNNHAAAWDTARSRTTAPGLVYSSEPEWTSWRGTILDTWQDFGSAGMGTRATDVAWHQYSENELGARLDLDLCNEVGYAHLWLAHAVPPAPETWRVTYPCDLKTAASHASRVAIDNHVPPRPVHLERGAEVLPVGAPVHTDDVWQAVTLPNSPVHGYVPVASIKQD